MNEKMNPWMLSTTLLVGLIIGFSIGKFGPNIQPQLEAANTQNIPTTNTGNGITNPTPPVAPTPPAPPVDYSSIEKGKDENGHWTLGSKTAKVKIEEFSDFQCPFCHKFFQETFPFIFQDYIAQGKIYYVYYNYPLSFHPQAKKAAEAALCAGDQQKFWEMHDVLFNSQDKWGYQNDDVSIYTNLAQTLGMNPTTFKQCLTSNKYTKQVEADTAVGTTRKVTGTPTFFINGSEKIVGAQDYVDFRTAIENQLNAG